VVVEGDPATDTVHVTDASTPHQPSPVPAVHHPPTL